MQRLPLHPRLARMLIAAKGAWPVVQACALLAERHYFPVRSHTTTSDLLSAIDGWDAADHHVKQAARDIRRTIDRSFTSAVETMNEERLPPRDSRGIPGPGGQATGRRGRGASSWHLAPARYSGARAVSLTASFSSRLTSRPGKRAPAAVRRHEGRWTSPPVNVAADSRIRIASRIERDWLQPNAREVERWFDPASGEARAAIVERYDALVLSQRPVPIEDEQAAELLAQAWLGREPNDADAQLLRRLEFAGHAFDLAALVRVAAYGARALSQVHLARAHRSGRPPRA